MNFLERYRSGEYEQVWSEMQVLGPAIRQEPDYSLAREVAAETMRRVRRNCERIVSRLRSAGYVFGTFPDGSTGYYTNGPLVAPSVVIPASAHPKTGMTPGGMWRRRVAVSDL